MAALLVVLALGLFATPAVRRGEWSRLVPTTALIAWMGSWDAPDPNGTWRARLGASLSTRFTQDELWGWQRRWLINRACSGDASRPHGSPAWTSCYAPLLAKLHWLDLQGGRGASGNVLMMGQPISLTPTPQEALQARESLLRSFVTALPMPDRPGHAFVRIDKSRNLLRGSYDLELRDITDTAADPWRRTTPYSWAWTDGAVLAARIGQTKSVSLGARAVSRRAPPAAPIEFWSADVEIPVAKTADPSRLVPVESPALTEVLASRLLPGFALGSYYDGVPLLWIDFPGPRSAFDASAGSPLLDAVRQTTSATIALRFEVLCNHQVIADGSAWWHGMPPTPADNHPGGQLIALERIRTANPAPDATWILRITGDPTVALRDPGATQYWKGQVEVPFRVRQGATPWPTLEELEALHSPQPLYR